MKKLILMVLCACVLLAGAVADAEPAPEPVYYDFILDDYEYSDWSEAEIIAELGEAYEDADEPGSRGTCTGVCHYNYSGNDPVEIQCDVGAGSSVNTIVGRDYHSVNDKIIMCNYVYLFGIWQWIRVGSCDRDSITKLLVNGNDDDDAIVIVDPATPLPGTGCDFKVFTSAFEAGWLKVYGQDGCDAIQGSEYDDYHLEGEYVEGEGGDDYIQLTNNDVTCAAVGGIPKAHGQEGSDEIYGTEITDYIWADYPVISAGSGLDYVDGEQGNDQVAGGYRDDEIYGGYGNDQLWGGADDDVLYGEENDDFLYGGDGDGDVCNGGSGADTCDEACETQVSC